MLCMPNFHDNAPLLASELDKAFTKARRKRGDAAKMAGVTSETVRRWLLGEIPSGISDEKLHGLDQAAGWKKGECRRILADGVDEAPPVDFLEVLTDTLQAHLAANLEEANGARLTGDESREQIAAIVEKAYVATIDQMRGQNAVSPPEKPDSPGTVGDEAPRTLVSPGVFGFMEIKTEKQGI